MDDLTPDGIPVTEPEGRDPVFASRPVSAEGRLLAENRRLRDLVALLTSRLDTLQLANEGAYRELAASVGGARLDPAQPFPPDPPRMLGQLPRPRPRPFPRRFL
ncbi:hypothetical protein [Streptomyces sp. NPDC001089]